MIELRYLKTFLAVAEVLSFRRAAEQLHTSQSAVSKIIAQLEMQVGTPLLVRDTRSVVLTAAGTALRDRARDVLARAEDAIETARRAAAGLVGTLTLGYMDIAIISELPWLVARFRNTFPDVNVDLVYGWTDRQRHLLQEGSIDIGFVNGPFLQQGYGTYLFSQKNLMAVVPAEHPLAKRDEITLGSLAEEPFILGIYEQWRPLVQLIGRMCGRAGFEPKVVQEVPFRDAMFGLIAAGFGVTLYPESATNVPRQGVKLLRLIDCPETSEVYAVWKTAGTSPSAKLFLSFMKEELSRKD